MQNKSEMTSVCKNALLLGFSAVGGYCLYSSYKMKENFDKHGIKFNPAQAKKMTEKGMFALGSSLIFSPFGKMALNSGMSSCTYSAMNSMAHGGGVKLKDKYTKFRNKFAGI